MALDDDENTCGGFGSLQLTPIEDYIMYGIELWQPSMG